MVGVQRMVQLGIESGLPRYRCGALPLSYDTTHTITGEGCKKRLNKYVK